MEVQNVIEKNIDLTKPINVNLISNPKLMRNPGHVEKFLLARQKNPLENGIYFLNRSNYFLQRL